MSGLDAASAARLADTGLREYGEKLAAAFPGYHNMGISPVAKVCPRPPVTQSHCAALHVRRLCTPI